MLVAVVLSGLLWLWLDSETDHTMAESVEPQPLVVSAFEREPEVAHRPVFKQEVLPEAVPVESEPIAIVTSEPTDNEVAVQNGDAIAEIVRSTRLDEPSNKEPVNVKPVDAASEPDSEVSSMHVERIELTHQQQIARLQQQAYEAEQHGHTEQARQRWQQLMALEPTVPEPYIALAQAAQRRANEAGVQYWLQLALEQGVEAVDVHELLAASFARQQLWAAVLKQLALIPAHAITIESRALQATAWQQLGQHQRALTAFEWLAQQQPQQARWWLGMALSHDALGHTEQALSLFGRSLQLDGNLNPATVSYIQQRIQDLN